LLLPAGQSIKTPIGQGEKAHALQGSLNVTTTGARPLDLPERHHLPHRDRERPINPASLRHQRHPGTTTLNRLISKPDPACLGQELTLQQLQQGGLPGTIRAHQRRQGSGFQEQIHVTEGLLTLVGVGKALSAKAGHLGGGRAHRKLLYQREPLRQGLSIVAS
jgi:hypothetical protein